MKVFKLNRKSPAEAAVYGVVSLLFLVIALSYLYIVFWALMSGAKTHDEIVMNPFAPDINAQNTM